MSIKKKSILSFILAFCMILSTFSSITFADEKYDITFNGTGYNFSENASITITLNNSSSTPKKTQISKSEILNGMTFNDVLPDSVTNINDANARLKNLSINSITNGKTQIQRSSSIDFTNVTSIDTYDTTAQTISAATISIDSEWDTSYAFFSPKNTADASDIGTWSDNTTTARLYYKEDNNTASPQRIGYTFSGWQNGSTTGILWGSTVIHTPKWTANKIKLTGKTFNVLFNSEMETYTLSAENGTGSYSYSINEGSVLPSGIVLENGVLKGKFSEIGTFNVFITATDLNSGSTATAKFVFDIAGDESLKVIFPEIPSAYPYGTKLSDIPLNGQGNGTFQWKEADTVADVENDGYTVVFTPNGNTEDYGSNFHFERPVDVTITPADAVMETVPFPRAVYLYKELNETLITGGKVTGISGEVLKGTYTWKEPSTVYTTTTTETETAIFTPISKNYNPIEFDLTFTVRRYSSSSTVYVDYTVRASSSTGGTISPKGDLSFREYDDVTFTIKPDTGYKIDSVKVDGEEINLKNNNSYTFKSLTEDHRIYAKFTKTKANSDNYDTEDDEDDEDDEDEKEKDNVENNTQTSDTLDISSIFNTTSHIAYIQGYANGTFKPKNSLTRAEACVILAEILKDDMSDKNYTSSFSDVNSADWYYNYIGFLSSKGIINGYTDGTFRPNAPITRAEFAHIIATALKLNISNNKYGNTYNDTANHWASNSISAISYYGWLKGYGNNTFKPSANITRAETTSFINSVLGRKSIDETSYSGINITVFSDISKSDWFYNDVIEAANAHNYTYSNYIEKWNK